MSDLSSLSSLSDEEVEEVQKRRIRIIKDRKNLFEIYDEEEFKEKFRFSKETVMKLLHLFGNRIEPTTNRNKSISALNQLLITLNFYASGDFQQVIGDNVNAHKSTISRIIHRVTDYITLQRKKFIKMPDVNEIQSLKEDFYKIANFPDVLGVVDCTHVKIQSPGGVDAEIYRNNKGYFSINVQIACDPNMKIIHIIARWPGSVPDIAIFNDGPLKLNFEHGLYQTGYLLGDSQYACKDYLLTPLLNARSGGEKAYNRAHLTTWKTVKRCVGIWKKRFPCLDSGMRININKCLRVIVACAVLHNIGIMQHDEVVDDFNSESHEEENYIIGQLEENTRVRSELIGRIFSIR